MVATARQVHLSYFDHPPLAWWLTHASIALFGSESHLAARLPFVAAVCAHDLAHVPDRRRARSARLRGWLPQGLLNLSRRLQSEHRKLGAAGRAALCAFAAAAYCLVRVLLEPVGERACLAMVAWAPARRRDWRCYRSIRPFCSSPGVSCSCWRGPASAAWLRRRSRTPPPCSRPQCLRRSWCGTHDTGGHRLRFNWVGPARPVPSRYGSRLGALGTRHRGQIAWIFPWIWVPLVCGVGPCIAPSTCRRPSLVLRLSGCRARSALFTGVSLGGQPGLPHWPASGLPVLFPLLGAIVMRYLRRQSSM